MEKLAVDDQDVVGICLFSEQANISGQMFTQRTWIALACSRQGLASTRQLFSEVAIKDSVSLDILMVHIAILWSFLKAFWI